MIGAGLLPIPLYEWRVIQSGQGGHYPTLSATNLVTFPPKMSTGAFAEPYGLAHKLIS